MYTVRVVFHGSADHRPGNARTRLSSSLSELRVLRGAHCDWIASLLNAIGAIQYEHEGLIGSSGQELTVLWLTNKSRDAATHHVAHEFIDDILEAC